MSEDHGLPYVEVPAKRSADKVPVQFDWHDLLANQWVRGAQQETGVRIRGSRQLSTGLEYEATTGGYSGRVRPIFPTTAGLTVRDGSVIWTARAMSNASLRATIVSSTFPAVDGLTFTDQSNVDLVHTIYVSGGVDGSTYMVTNRVTLSNPPGEIVEKAALLPVVD